MVLYAAMGKAVKQKRPYNASLRREQAQMTRSRILEAARQRLAKGTYSSVTMEDIAREAGVSYQTVYSVFGTKLGLAEEIIRVGFQFEAVEELAAQLRESTDPEVWLRGTAQISRRIQETCADLLRFMRESGDPQLLARYHQHQELRLTQEGFLPGALERSGRLRAGLSKAEALAVIWAMTGPEVFAMLVFERGMTPSRYEEWLGTALISLLLDPG
jgi:TetR/AcrR family transcriptional regulator, regulator of autoinduction and epiphytic fitness